MLKIGDMCVGRGAPLSFILGPCVMEDAGLVFAIAEELKRVCPYPFIFKASYDKANRISIHSYRGPGLKAGMQILRRIKEELGLLVTTDIHLPEEARAVSEVIDLIQIPAFLCRQTDILVAAAKTGLPVHVKKGQFVSPFMMQGVIEKLKESGCDQILLTERGASFGYNNLVSDMRSIPIMQGLGVPVCYDASHSVQLPGGLGSSSGGDRIYIPTLAKAAVAAGADMLFIETHPDPATAKSDAATQWPLSELPPLLHTLHSIHQLLQPTSLLHV